MIKCNVTVCGTVCRQAQMRANKEGKQFISFGISVVVQHALEGAQRGCARGSDYVP